jgi:hypothetical protein
MNYTRVLLAALGAFVAYFVFGGVAFAVTSLKNEFMKYPAVYRSQESIKAVMPAGMAAMFVAMTALAMIYATTCRDASSVAAGARFGALVGVFAIGSFVIHNYANLNIGWALTVQQAVMYFIEWVIVGAVLGAIYQPPVAH